MFPDRLDRAQVGVRVETLLSGRFQRLLERGNGVGHGGGRFAGQQFHQRLYLGQELFARPGPLGVGERRQGCRTAGGQPPGHLGDRAPGQDAHGDTQQPRHEVGEVGRVHPRPTAVVGPAGPVVGHAGVRAEHHRERPLGEPPLVAAQPPLRTGFRPATQQLPRLERQQHGVVDLAAVLVGLAPHRGEAGDLTGQLRVLGQEPQDSQPRGQRIRLPLGRLEQRREVQVARPVVGQVVQQGGHAVQQRRQLLVPGPRRLGRLGGLALGRRRQPGQLVPRLDRGLDRGPLRRRTGVLLAGVERRHHVPHRHDAAAPRVRVTVPSRFPRDRPGAEVVFGPLAEQRQLPPPVVATLPSLVGLGERMSRLTGVHVAEDDGPLPAE